MVTSLQIYNSAYLLNCLFANNYITVILTFRNVTNISIYWSGYRFWNKAIFILELRAEALGYIFPLLISIAVFKTATCVFASGI